MFSDWVDAGGNLIAMRPGQAARRPARADQHRGHTLCERLPAGRHVRRARRPGSSARRSSSTGRPTSTRSSGADGRRHAVLQRRHRHGQPGGDAAQRRLERRPGGGVHLRPGPLDRLHAPGQPGLGRPGARRRAGPIRSNDLFYGNAAVDPQPDWVDLNKVAIPQADEQQRLLANLIVDDEPRPQAAAALLVLPARREGGRGHDRRRPRQRRHRRPLRPVQGAEPARLLGRRLGVRPRQPRTSTRTLRSTDAQAAAYDAQGFEIALHVNTGCGNFTPASLDRTSTTSSPSSRAKYTERLTAPATNRTHCIAWSD